MSTYASSVLLKQVPTGYGGYTGVCITNSGNFPVRYKIYLSDTTFDSSVTPLKAINGIVPNTIFISDSLSNPDLNSTSIVKDINANDSGLFYLLHRPFKDFSSSTYYATGKEFATVSIESSSSVGGSDNILLINVTGQRVTGFEIPQKMVDFYAVKDYSAAVDQNAIGLGVFVDFHWRCPNVLDYYSGFKLDFATDSGFSSFSTEYISVQSNSNINLPKYGNYDGFYNKEYSFKKTDLAFSQDYYARLCPVNMTGGTGEFVYPKVYTEYYPVLSDAELAGTVPSPGDNLRLDPTGLYITYPFYEENNFDLFAYLYRLNNNSADFSKYTGINIKFVSNGKITNGLSTMVSSNALSGAINFVNSNNKPFAYSVDANYKFRMEMEFENIGLYGCGGIGGAQNPDFTYSDPQNGGCIFNLDSLSYQDPTDATKTRSIDYYIYKDLDSLFYAGLAGTQAIEVTNSNDTDQKTVINGYSLPSLKTVNLRQRNDP